MGGFWSSRGWLAWLLLASSLNCASCRSARESQAHASPASSSRPRAELSSEPELAGAQRAAIDRLSEFRKALERAEPATLDFEVQAAVRDGALSEALWLIEVKPTVDGFTGSLNTQPQVLKSIQRGQQVTVSNQDVLDWSYFDHGKQRGGQTRVVLATQRRRAELADALGKCGERRYADGCATLGTGYENGRVGEKNLRVARDLYTRACDGGSSYGCNAAAWATLHGRGGPRDPPAAAALFARACVRGDEHPFACDSRGFALLTGLAGTKRDLSLAFRLLGKACAHELAPSCLLLELARVKGLRRGAPQKLACDVDFSEHVSRCMGEGDPESCFLAGSAIETGVCHVPKSERRSADLLRRAAAFGAAWPNASPSKAQGS